MPPTNTVRTRADWVQILEAAVAEEPDDRRWAEGVLETARPVFPRASMMGLLVVPSEDRLVEDSIHVMPEVRAGDAERHLLQLANVPDGGFRMFMHPPVPVTTHGEILRAASPDLKAFMRDVAPARAYRDAVGLVTHPVPNVTVVLWAGHDHELLLSRHERELLMRVAAHIEAGYRARKSLRSVKAVLAEDGRLLSRDEDAPAAGALETYGQRIRSVPLPRFATERRRD